jgi:hypothetical protein
MHSYLHEEATARRARMWGDEASGYSDNPGQSQLRNVTDCTIPWSRHLL